MFVEHKEQGEVTEAPAKTMKLSEAMRIGAGLRPQIRSQYFDGTGSCAIGAAWEGAGKQPGYCSGSCVRDLFGVPDAIIGTIVNKNDGGETREQIADWLERKGF